MHYVLALLLAVVVCCAAEAHSAEKKELKHGMGWLCDDLSVFMQFSNHLDIGASKPWAAYFVNERVIGNNACDYYDYRYHKVRSVALINTNGVIEEVWEIKVAVMASSTTTVYFPPGYDMRHFMYGAFENTGTYIPIPRQRPLMGEPADKVYGESDVYPKEYDTGTTNPPEVELPPPEYKFKV